MNLTKKQRRELEEKTQLMGIKPEQLPEEMQEALANLYVDTFRKGHLIYTQKFYQDLYQKIDHGMTYVQAYEALGFNAEALGHDRANAAGKRAVQMAEDQTLYKISPGDFDGTVPLEEMKKKNLSSEEMAAYMEARCMYLEVALEYEKEKKRSLYWEKYSELKKAREKK